MTHKIHPAAHERILEIWEYTERVWGEEQADRYVTGLFEELDQIASSSHRWRPVNQAGFESVYFARYRHHFIFFRKLPSGCLGVINILHENMNIPDRLLENKTMEEEEEL